jgi:hypothetical protein
MLSSRRPPSVVALLAFAVVACSSFREVAVDQDAGDGSAMAPDSDGGAADATASDGAGRVDAPAACVPSCLPGRCGDNGCGAACPTCLGTKAICTDAGQCCTPFCGTQDCGDDGCGGSCGTCPSLYTCVIHGTCQKNPGSVCGAVTCGSAASCCHCNGSPICFTLSSGQTCAALGAGCS